MTEYSIRVKDVTKSFKTSRKIGDLKEKTSWQKKQWRQVLKLQKIRYQNG